MTSPRRVDIEYESEGFAAGAAVANGKATLSTNWNELLWAALTVGRPNRQYVFKNGNASMYEAVFRLSMMRMALEQNSPASWRLRRTDAAKTLDPSEKGAVNYFLGLVVCKLFADRLLNAPWMMHLDIWRSQLGAVLTGRSRPDLVGKIRGGNSWIALECKGRVSKPDSDSKNKAKDQALRLVSVNGVAPSLHIGGFAYFRSDVLQFYWRDPTPERPIKNPIHVEVAESDWRYYYGPVLDLIRASWSSRVEAPNEVLFPVEGLDMQIGIDPVVLKLLEAAEWGAARTLAEEVSSGEHPQYRGDGIRVVAGESWLRRFEERE
jgi:hypothetical protein